MSWIPRDHRQVLPVLGYCYTLRSIFRNGWLESTKLMLSWTVTQRLPEYHFYQHIKIHVFFKRTQKLAPCRPNPFPRANQKDEKMEETLPRILRYHRQIVQKSLHGVEKDAPHKPLLVHLHRFGFWEMKNTPVTQWKSRLVITSSREEVKKISLPTGVKHSPASKFVNCLATPFLQP